MRVPTVAAIALFFSVSPLPAPPALPAQPAPPAPKAQERPRLFPAQDLGLIETPDRVEWQKPDLIMDKLKIADGSVVAELGAGGGWFTMQLARRVGPNGVVWAEEVQRVMVEFIGRRAQRENVPWVRATLGTATDPRLPRTAGLPRRRRLPARQWRPGTRAAGTRCSRGGDLHGEGRRTEPARAGHDPAVRLPAGLRQGDLAMRAVAVTRR
jgi:tRNA methyltransferase complex GCD14 subunit